MELRKNDFVVITGFALLCLTAVSLTGCYSSITAREVTKDPKALGLRYFLPSPYLIIRHLPNDTWDAELQVFVDRSHTFAVQPNAWFAKSDFSLVNNADGTIKSFKLGQDTTVVAAASITAAKDIASKEMELRQQMLDRQIQAAHKSSSETLAAGTGAGGGGTSGGASGGTGGAPQTPKGAAAADTKAGGAPQTPKGAAAADTKAGGAPQTGNEPENATSHLKVDWHPRQVFVYRIVNSGLEQAGPVATVSVPTDVKKPVAEVFAPIAVNQYEPKSDGGATAVTSKTLEGITWFPPIDVKLDNEKEFRITLPESWAEVDKKFFLFFTDDEGRTPLDAKVADPLRKKFTFNSGVFSVKLEDLKGANVRSVRFNKTM